MTEVRFVGLTKTEMRDHISTLCVSAIQAAAITGQPEQMSDAIALFHMCNATALAIEKEHSGLFEELTSLSTALLRLADSPAVNREKVSDTVRRVLEQLKTY